MAHGVQCFVGRHMMSASRLLLVALLPPCASYLMPTRAHAPPVPNRLGCAQMGTWVELGSCSTPVNVPAPIAYDIISDYPRWPEWSPWLKRVDTFDEDASGATSRWHLKFQAVDVSWGSKVVECIPGSLARWESTSGVRNSGSLRTTPHEDASSCTLTISLRYEIPALVAKLFSARFVSKLVSRRLEADLGRFRRIAESEHAAAGAPGTQL